MPAIISPSSVVGHSTKSSFPLPASLSSHWHSHAVAATVRHNTDISKDAKVAHLLPTSRSRAHHVSLPLSPTSNNLFRIDFGNFSLDDLSLEEFARRSPGPLSSSPIALDDTNTATATSNATGVGAPSTKVTFESARLNTKRPVGTTPSSGKSRFSFPDKVWPSKHLARPKTISIDDSIGKNDSSRNNTPLSLTQHSHDAPKKTLSHRPSRSSVHLPIDRSNGATPADGYSPLAIDIPSDSFVDDAFLSGFHFSKRGSVILGGNRVVSRTAIDRYLQSLAPTSLTTTTDDKPDTNTTRQSAVPPPPSSTGSATTHPSNTASGQPARYSISSCSHSSVASSSALPSPASHDEELQNDDSHDDSPAWLRPPLLRKTSPTPSPSLASLLSPRLPREPTYDIIDVLTEAINKDTPQDRTQKKSKKNGKKNIQKNEQNQKSKDLNMSPTPTDLLAPPLPDLEQESHKVRSLYEAGDTLCWEDGAPTTRAVSSGGGSVGASASSERLEPMPEAPEDGENALVTPVTSHLAPAWATPRSVSSSLSHGRDSGVATKREFELAGGLEDWQNVDSRDVDRYGFINPKGADSRVSTPTEGRQQQMQGGRGRRLLSKKDTFGGSLHSHSYLGRKVSARSLNTQASEVSALSWRSTRSVVRQAANLLPVNRERRWMDEAGDMLTLAPGISDISDDVDAARLSDSLKRKEWQRTEKWRKMAIIKTLTEPGLGQQYDFNMKDPKLIDRTWKGIPDCWRAAAWWSFLDQSAKETGTAPSEEGIVASFLALQTKPCTDDVQIDLDVPRTISSTSCSDGGIVVDSVCCSGYCML